MNYQQLYKALPVPTQKAIRELMAVLNKCNPAPVVRDKTICQSRLETATIQVEICIREIKERFN